MNPEQASDSQSGPNDLLAPRIKIDMRYFTDKTSCPLMVRQKSRRAFELFLLIATRTHAGQAPRPFSHEELSAACGLAADSANSRSIISRLLRQLRSDYMVLSYEPQRGRRPVLALRPPATTTRIGHVWMQPWSAELRMLFEGLGSEAFAAEYMFVIAAYEAKLASGKRDYWFFPLERISELYHISERFAGSGLRALVRAGMLRVMHGQYKRASPENHFGKANRYYFRGIDGALLLQERQARLQESFPQQYELALKYSCELTNGPSAKNLAELCQLIASAGPERVGAAIRAIARFPKTSLRRRAAYLRWLVEGAGSG